MDKHIYSLENGGDFHRKCLSSYRACTGPVGLVSLCLRIDQKNTAKEQNTDNIEHGNVHLYHTDQTATGHEN